MSDIPIPIKKPSDVCRKPCKDMVSVPFTNLSDFTGTYCEKCYKVLSWEKIKPLKATEKEAPSAVTEVQPIKTPAKKQREQKVKFVLEGAPQESDPIEEEAPVINVPEIPMPSIPKVLPPIEQIQAVEPIKVEAPAEVISPELTGQFPVHKVERMPLLHLLLLYLVTEHGEEFSCVLDAGTDEKASKIFAIREQVAGKMVNIIFDKWQDNKPFGLRFKGFVK